MRLFYWHGIGSRAAKWLSCTDCGALRCCCLPLANNAIKNNTGANLAFSGSPQTPDQTVVSSELWGAREAGCLLALINRRVNGIMTRCGFARWKPRKAISLGRLVTLLSARLCMLALALHRSGSTEVECVFAGIYMCVCTVCMHVYICMHTVQVATMRLCAGGRTDII